MDADGAVVQRFPPREGNWTLRASLDDLACISSDSGRCTTLLVMDLSTGKALLPTEDVVAGVLMYASCGRAARTSSLKVFRLDAQLICKVLALGNGASRWRQVQSPPPMVSHWNKITSSSVVTLNGALYFMSQDHYDVLSFDLDNETWKVIPGPPAGIVGTKKSISLADLNGTLCMARKVHPLVADIWLLTDTDSNSWIKAYSIPVDLFADFVVPLRRHVSVGNCSSTPPMTTDQSYCYKYTILVRANA
ncbi:hypothetical protein ACQ4PT_039608 [Festuca glaucescens]